MVTKTWVKGMLTRFFNNLHKVAISGDYNDLENKLVVNTTALNPTGTIINFFGLETQVPEGYLPCNGAEYLIEDYPILANHLAEIDTALSRTDYTGSDTDHFKVPDLRGEFLRCTGTNTHKNNSTNQIEGSGANVGIHQGATVLPECWYPTSDYGTQLYFNKDFYNKFFPQNADSVIQSDYTTVGADNANSRWGNISSSRTGTNVYTMPTTRPTNTSVLYCIKY